jgi:hypothetical protein
LASKGKKEQDKKYNGKGIAADECLHAFYKRMTKHIPTSGWFMNFVDH